MSYKWRGDYNRTRGFGRDVHSKKDRRVGGGGGDDLSPIDIIHIFKDKSNISKVIGLTFIILLINTPFILLWWFFDYRIKYFSPTEMNALEFGLYGGTIYIMGFIVVSVLYIPTYFRKKDEHREELGYDRIFQEYYKWDGKAKG